MSLVETSHYGLQYPPTIPCVALANIQKGADYHLYILDPFMLGVYDTRQLTDRILKQTYIPLDCYKVNYVRCVDYTEIGGYWNSSTRQPVFANAGRVIKEIKVSFIDLLDGSSIRCVSNHYGKQWLLRNFVY